MQQSDYSQQQHLRGRYTPLTRDDKCQDSELILDIHYVTLILIAFVQCWVTNGLTLI